MSASLQAPTLVDALYEALRKEILSGALSGGEKLTESTLAARFAVARPTAKSAMERLIHDGLLTRATNKSARVPVFGPNDIRDLYYARGFIERDAVARLSAQRTVPPRAERAISALREFSDEDFDPVSVGAADAEFHNALVEALDSPRLLRAYTSLIGEVQLCVAQFKLLRPVIPSEAAQEHAAILDAVRSGDEAVALAAMNHHLQRSCDRLTTYLESAADAPLTSESADGEAE
jgi:DNA-binding GntR family transcriptional regulator